MVSEYEKQRARNIEQNVALLQSLGLDKPLLEPKEKPRKTKPLGKKRKATSEAEIVEDAPTNVKAPRLSSEVLTDTSVRRSSRNAGKKVDYTSEQQRRDPLPLAYSSGVKTTENTGPLGSEGGGIRTYDPKTFGTIPGVQVGTWWETRQGCSSDSIHAPWVAGISGGSGGAYSVALSGGYDDDVDLGYAFTYTGSGGRDLKGTKDAPKNLRTAPQSSDQSFENSFNKALKRSSETGNPVRVIRGFKLKSRYAPSEGYRYDGLYKVEKAWMEKGLNPKGYLVCKFAFKRIPGQPPLPVRADAEDAVEPKDETASKAEPSV
ncbi:E3 ubiquitin-protein ligase ORTHRUS 5 [Hypsizygus marmoreus]|uniref:E3 ubiquitin-protein ligase ORTHRUS 5 n=1 Tax=Hypsizygus marmoreus TaxID=39966 RepID=A0A369KB27_HYPMA|nr:E3 ubiquitin-protein ligase ORTHRUS 5 [Hypsizygus marmoreus]